MRFVSPRFILAWLTLVVAPASAPLVFAAPARAQQRGAPTLAAAVARPLEADVVLGLGSPVGFVGAELGYAPSPWFVARAGLGWSRGLQADLSVAVRASLGRVVLGLEGGASFGRYEQQPTLGDSLACAALLSVCFQDGEGAGRVLPNVWEPAAWGHASITFEYRHPAGPFTRFAIGYQILLNDRAGGCDVVSGSGDVCAAIPSETGLMFVSLAMGYAFDV